MSQLTETKLAEKVFKRVFRPFPAETRSQCLPTGFAPYQDLFRTVKKA